MSYPSEQEYHRILEQTTGAGEACVEPISSAEEILALRDIVRSVAVSDQVRTYVIRLVLATQPGSELAPSVVSNSVLLGSSPRGAQGLMLMGKVRALLDGRFAVSCQDIRDVAPAVLRHRLLLSFEGHARRVDPDDLVQAVIDAVSELSE